MGESTTIVQCELIKHISLMEKYKMPGWVMEVFRLR